MMSQHRKTLTFADAAFVIAGLLLVGWLQVNGAEPVERTTYLADRHLDTFGPPPHQNHQKAMAAYEKFTAESEYYGAFANAQDGSFGWADNHSSQDRADSMAMARCAKYSQSCQITARLSPTVVTLFEGHPLSQTQAMALDRFPTLPNHKAIALSNYGIWGAAWERTAPFVAKQAALRQCRKRLEEEGLDQQGGFACRLAVELN